MKIPLPTLPPNIAWPLMIVALLLTSITASSYTFYKAHSDGGPAIVNNYYEKGKHWNETAAAKKAGSGLVMDVAVLAPSENQALRPVEVTIRDAGGEPVTGFRGMLHALRPHKAAPVATVPLQPVDGRPGVFRQSLPVNATGVWDFQLDGTRGEVSVQKTVRLRLSSL
jgi:hypothetical protein